MVEAARLATPKADIYRGDSSVVCFLYLLIHTNTISPTILVMSSFKPSRGSAHKFCIGSLILVPPLLGVASLYLIEN